MAIVYIASPYKALAVREPKKSLCDECSPARMLKSFA